MCTYSVCVRENIYSCISRKQNKQKLIILVLLNKILIKLIQFVWMLVDKQMDKDGHLDTL